jgi:hypothetical protein
MVKHREADLVEAIQWAAGDDTGVSSKAIMLRMVGGMPRWDSWPRDPADLGRCLRLLARVPAWHPRIGEMAPISGPWGALAGAWGDLEELMTEEGAVSRGYGARGDKTYAMMRRLIDSGLRTDPRIRIIGERGGEVTDYQWTGWAPL